MKKIKNIFRHENIGILYVLPAFIFLSVLVIYPIISNIILSLQDVTVMTLIKTNKPFIGIDNYKDVFSDPILLNSIKNTIIFTLSCLVLQFIIGFALALVFKNNFVGSKPIRGILMMPWMIPITVTALIFKFMFTTNVGIINQVLQALNLISHPIEWLTTPTTAFIAIIVANIWIGIPFNMILLSTGLTTIPEDLYESASIDGASKIQKFFKITLPLLKPTIQSVLILGFIYTFKVFDLVYVMTGGGPVNTTHVLSTYSYKLSFELFQYGKGAAVANILFVLLFIVSIFYIKFSYPKKEN